MLRDKCNICNICNIKHFSCHKILMQHHPASPLPCNTCLPQRTMIDAIKTYRVPGPDGTLQPRPPKELFTFRCGPSLARFV